MSRSRLQLAARYLQEEAGMSYQFALNLLRARASVRVRLLHTLTVEQRTHVHAAREMLGGTP